MADCDFTAAVDENSTTQERVTGQAMCLVADARDKAEALNATTEDLITQTRDAITGLIAELPNDLFAPGNLPDFTYADPVGQEPALPTTAEETGVTFVDNAVDPSSPIQGSYTQDLTVAGSVGMEDLPANFVGTTPEDPGAAPVADDLLILDEEWNRLRDLTTAEITRTTTTNQWTAANLAAARGAAVPPIVTTLAGNNAQQKALEAIQAEAQKSTIQYATFRREDVLSAYDRHLARYSAMASEQRQRWQIVASTAIGKYQAERQALIAAYSEERKISIDEYRTKHAALVAQFQAQFSSLISRHQQFWQQHLREQITKLEFERTEASTELDRERLDAEYEIRKIQITQENTTVRLTDLTQIYAQLCTAYLSASNTGVSTSSGWSYGLPFSYDTSKGLIS